MRHHNKLNPVHLTDQKALRLLHTESKKQYRSLANLTAFIIIQALDKGDDNTASGKPQVEKKESEV